MSTRPRATTSGWTLERGELVDDCDVIGVYLSTNTMCDVIKFFFVQGCLVQECDVIKVFLRTTVMLNVINGRAHEV